MGVFFMMEDLAHRVPTLDHERQHASFHVVVVRTPSLVVGMPLLLPFCSHGSTMHHGPLHVALSIGQKKV
jgi:hypothetical protein